MKKCSELSFLSFFPFWALFILFVAGWDVIIFWMLFDENDGELMVFLQNRER